MITTGGYNKYIQHAGSHHLGLDVHDVWGSSTLKAGMVISIEPRIHIVEDSTELAAEYRGFGIRIGDNLLVTENGCVVLPEEIPKESDEVVKF